MEVVNYKEESFITWNALVAILFIVIFISFIGRVAIAHIPFGGLDDYNETSYAGGARNLVHGNGSLWAFINVENNRIFEVTPFLMYLLYFFFKLFGVSEQTARLVPIIMSTATIPFVFYLGRLIFNRYVGILAAILYAVNSMFNLYGFIVQADSVFVFFMVASLCLYVKSLKEDKFVYFVLAGISSGIGVFSKQTALLVAIIVAMTEFSRVFIEKIRFKTFLGRVFLFWALSLSVSLPWAIHNYIQWGMGFLSHLDGEVTLGQRSWLRAGGFILRTFELFYLPFIAGGLILSLKKNILKLLLVNWFVCVLLLLYFKNPHNYYTLPIIPVSLIFAAYAIYKLFFSLKSISAKRVLKLTVLIFIVFSILFTYKRFLNRKMGCDEVISLKEYCDNYQPRIVFSVSGVYKAERYYIDNPLEQFADMKRIAEERKGRFVFVYYRIADQNNSDLAGAIEKEADSAITITQKKYNFFLKKREVPVYRVYKFNKLKSA